MELDMDRVLVFWEEDRMELRSLRGRSVGDERALYAYATQLQKDADRIHHLCDTLDQLSATLSETAD